MIRAALGAPVTWGEVLALAGVVATGAAALYVWWVAAGCPGSHEGRGGRR